jgi:hypothetical protein
MSFGVRSLLTPDKVSCWEAPEAIAHQGPGWYSHVDPGNAWLELLSVMLCPTEVDVGSLNYRLLLSLAWLRVWVPLQRGVWQPLGSLGSAESGRCQDAIKGPLDLSSGLRRRLDGARKH